MKDLYFVAFTLPESVASTIQEIKKNFSERFGTKYGVETIPHITIIPPVRLDENEASEARLFLKSSASIISHFNIWLKGFDNFHKKVIYIRVSANESIQFVYQIVAPYFSKMPGIRMENFHPHVTIAHRDLNPKEFQEHSKYISNYKMDVVFTCNSISLLVHKSGKWEVDSTFSFEPN